ncbi:hypothetical protein [Burkholderia sp. MSMB0856]|uniref:hypothetical protein n=1 Tax=Burkholderia sp. MSMB0856 TaxID=1637869 RepID=UPI00131ED209|nr:hypothetical protein [Burkholderia sp. MSMB0856]
MTISLQAKGDCVYAFSSGRYPTHNGHWSKREVNGGIQGLNSHSPQSGRQAFLAILADRVMKERKKSGVTEQS